MKICHNCGRELENSMRNCIRCNEEQLDDAVIFKANPKPPPDVKFRQVSSSPQPLNINQSPQSQIPQEENILPQENVHNEGNGVPTPQAQPPVYQEPVQQPPVYQEPAQQPPVYQEPAQQPPVYQEPAQQPPVYQEPVQQPPVYQEPVQQPQTMESPNQPTAGVPPYAQGNFVPPATEDEAQQTGLPQDETLLNPFTSNSPLPEPQGETPLEPSPMVAEDKIDQDVLEDIIADELSKDEDPKKSTSFSWLFLLILVLVIVILVVQPYIKDAIAPTVSTPTIQMPAPPVTPTTQDAETPAVTDDTITTDDTQNAQLDIFPELQFLGKSIDDLQEFYQTTYSKEFSTEEDAINTQTVLDKDYDINVIKDEENIITSLSYTANENYEIDVMTNGIDESKVIALEFYEILESSDYTVKENDNNQILDITELNDYKFTAQLTHETFESLFENDNSILDMVFDYTFTSGVLTINQALTFTPKDESEISSEVEVEVEITTETPQQ